MKYIQKDENGTWTMSFDKVHRQTTTKVAKKMRKDLVTFFEKHPTSDLCMYFGGYARLSKEFATELFKKDLVGTFADRMVSAQMHVFDVEKVAAALR